MPRNPSVIDELSRRIAEGEQGPPLPDDVAQRERERLRIRENDAVRRLQERVNARPNAELAGVDPRTWTNAELEQAVGGVKTNYGRNEDPILDPLDPDSRAALTPEQVAYLENRIRAQRARQRPSEPDIIDRLGARISEPNAPSDEETIRAFREDIANDGYPEMRRASFMSDAPERKGFMANDDLGGVGIAAGAPQVGARGKRVGRTKHSQVPRAPEDADRQHTEFERQLIEAGAGKTLDLSGTAQQVQSRRRDAARAGLSGPVGESGPPIPAGTRRAEAERFGRQDDAAMIMGNPALAAAFESSQGTYHKVPRKDYPREQQLLQSTMGTTRRNPLTGEAEHVPGTIERTASAQEEILEQEAAEAEIYAGEMRRREVELAAADQARIQADQRHIDRYSAEVAAIQRQTEGLTRAADMMEKTPDLGSWWQDRSTGQKVGAILGMILGRMVGINPLDILNTAITAEQQRAKFNWQKRKDLVSGRREEQAGLINAYEVLAEYASSEQELDKLVQLSMYENAQRRLERMAAEGRVRVMPGQLELGRAAIDTRKAQLTYEAQGLAARSVPTKTVFSPKWPGPVRKTIRAEGAAEADLGRAIRKKGAEAQIEAAAKQGEPKSAEEKRILATAARDTADAYAAISTIDEMLKLAPTGAAPGKFGTLTIEDVVTLGTGYGKPLASLLTSDEKKSWDRYKSKMLLSTQKWLTGASVAPDQKPYFESLLAAVENASTAEDEVRAVQDLRNMMWQHNQAIEYGVGEEDRQELHRNPNLAPLPARNVGGGDSNTLPSGWDIPYK